MSSTSVTLKPRVAPSNTTAKTANPVVAGLQRATATASTPTPPLHPNAVCFFQHEDERLHYLPLDCTPQTGTFQWNHQDHVLGNIIERQLVRDPRVLFVGYKMPDPIEPIMEVQIRTVATSAPVEALRHGLSNASIEIGKSLAAFEQALA